MCYTSLQLRFHCKILSLFHVSKKNEEYKTWLVKLQTFKGQYLKESRRGTCHLHTVRENMLWTFSVLCLSGGFLYSYSGTFVLVLFYSKRVTLECYSSVRNQKRLKGTKTKRGRKDGGTVIQTFGVQQRRQEEDLKTHISSVGGGMHLHAIR